MGRINSQIKGKTYERFISKKFNINLSIQFFRVPNSGGLNIKGDVYTEDKNFPFVVECKNCQTYYFKRWLTQLDGEMLYERKHGILVFHRPFSTIDYCLLVPKNEEENFGIESIKKTINLNKNNVNKIEQGIYKFYAGYVMRLDTVFPIIKKYIRKKGDEYIAAKTN